MKKRIQFSITEEEAAYFKEYAKRKGLPLAYLSKMALFQYSHRFPVKGMELYGTSPDIPEKPNIAIVERKAQ